MLPHSSSIFSISLFFWLPSLSLYLVVDQIHSSSPTFSHFPIQTYQWFYQLFWKLQWYKIPLIELCTLFLLDSSEWVLERWESTFLRSRTEHKDIWWTKAIMWYQTNKYRYCSSNKSFRKSKHDDWKATDQKEHKKLQCSG